MKNFLSRTLATVAGTAATAVLAAGTVAPASAAATEYLPVDSDVFTLTQPGQPATARVEATSYLKGGSVQAAVKVRMSQASTLAGCRAARAFFTYADGRTVATAPSARVCQEHGATSLEVILRSSTSQDLVKYAVQLLTASDDDAPTTVVAGSTQLVGDAPDSYGTADRLDHDTHWVVEDGRTLFRGSANYYLNKHSYSTASWFNVRARVSGDLAWSDKLAGSRARVTAIWTYADGSQGYSRSAYVYRGATTTVPVRLTSSSDKDLVAVRLWVYSDGVGTGSSAAGNSTKFGDFNGIA